MKHRGALIIIVYLVLTAIALAFIPPVQQLGAWIRLIIFHGMLSVAGLYTIYAAGILGLLYLIVPQDYLGAWSKQLGFAAVIVWVIGTALSFVSMQVAWGGIILEPLTITALTIAVVGAGKEYLVRSSGASVKVFALANSIFAFSALIIRMMLSYMQEAGAGMHPDNPIGTSDSIIIRFLPMVVLALTLLAIFAYSRTRLQQGTD